MNFSTRPVSIITALLFFILLIASCKKEDSNNSSDKEQASLAAAEANAEADMIFNDVFDNIMGVNDEVGIAGTGVFGRYTERGNPATERPSACFTTTITALNPDSTFPLQAVIDFGTGGCEGKDGRIRKGRIIATYTGRLTNPGASATTTFEGYEIDGVRVEGTHIIKNSSGNSNRQFTIDIENARLSIASGNYISWNNHRIITQTSGLATPSITADDVFSVEGNAEGQVKKGAILAIWTSEITVPLIKKFLCWWIVQGRVKTTLGAANANDAWSAELDYGDGSCNRKAVIIINGATHEISLH